MDSNVFLLGCIIAVILISACATLIYHSNVERILKNTEYFICDTCSKSHTQHKNVMDTKCPYCKAELRKLKKW